MASAYPLARTRYHHFATMGAAQLARAMSWHASGALLTFAALQVAGVVVLAGLPGSGALPFVAFGLLMLLALPFSRALERRWTRLAHVALPSAGLVDRFRRDRARLWRMALLVPLGWLGFYAAMAEAAIL